MPTKKPDTALVKMPKSPTIKYKTLLIGMFLGIILSGFSYTHGGCTKSEVISIFAVIIALTTIFYNALHLQNNYNLNQEKLELDKKIATLNVLTEWHRDFSDYSRVGKYFREEYFIKKDYKGQVLIDAFYNEKDKDGNEFRKSINPILNYFEKICIGLEEDILNEKIVKDFFQEIFLAYYDTCITIMKDRRTGVASIKTAFIVYEKICLKWKNT